MHACILKATPFIEMGPVFLLALFSLLDSTDACSSGCSGTPLDFREKFISVCRNLQLSNCDEVWSAFGGAFRGRDPVNVMRESVYKFTILPLSLCTHFQGLSSVF